MKEDFKTGGYCAFCLKGTENCTCMADSIREVFRPLEAKCAHEWYETENYYTKCKRCNKNNKLC